MDPTRLMDDSGDRFERELLGAARRDEPAAGAIARGAAVLGLAATSASITATTAGTASAAGAKATGTVFGTAALAKWVGIGAAVGLVTTSGVRIMSDPGLMASIFTRSAPASGDTKEAPTRHASNPPQAAEALAPPAPEPETEANAESLAAAPPSMAPSPSAKSRAALAPVEPARVTIPPPTEPAPPSLAGELDALERARSALLLHRPSDALRALDDYGVARKTSVLEAEAELLRVEALLQSGKRDAAVRLAERALEESPNGSHAARLREIVDAK